MPHTIILIQTTPNQATRTYYDYESMTEALTGVCSIYEGILKKQQATSRRITYNVQELFEWIDKLHDFCGLVLNQKLSTYVPQDREYLKKKLYEQLSKQVQ
mmetsp:Transcript_4210/g.15882  ORF Transcript_4210/g.15882 Transcript_4210/m.15882 type:complete len:101 (-) Transcript_4210:429-731(-)